MRPRLSRRTGVLRPIRALEAPWAMRRSTGSWAWPSRRSGKPPAAGWDGGSGRGAGTAAAAEGPNTPPAPPGRPRVRMHSSDEALMRSVDTEGHLRGRDEGLVNELLLEHHAITWSVPWYDALVTLGVQRLRDKTKKMTRTDTRLPRDPGLCRCRRVARVLLLYLGLTGGTGQRNCPATYD